MNIKQILIGILAVGLIAAPAFTQAADIDLETIPPEVVLFKNVKVFNGIDDKLDDVDVLVVGNKIKKVAKNIPVSGSYEVDVRQDRVKEIPNPTLFGNAYSIKAIDEKGKVQKKTVAVKVIDGGGRTLTPGLSDSHQHIMIAIGTDPAKQMVTGSTYTTAYNAIPQAKKMLDMGITTIRDVGGPSIELGQAIDAGYVDGPRILSSGHFVSCTSGHGDFAGFRRIGPSEAVDSDANRLLTSGWSILADGPDDVRWAVRTALANGATAIKIMAGGGVASLKDPLETVGFSESEMRAAVEAATDYDTYVMAHAYNDESTRRAIRAGVKDIVHGHLIREKTVKMMAENDVWLGSLSKPVGLMEVPFFTEENRRKGRLVLAGYDNVMTWAKKYKVKMGFGTDAASTMVDTILMEFEARSKFFTPYEMLKQATSINAELFAMAKTRNPYRDAPLGVIKEGAWADILLYDGNPLKDIQVAINYKETLDLIMKDGKIYKNTL